MHAFPILAGTEKPAVRRPPALLRPGAAQALLQATGSGARGHRDRALVIVLWRGLLRCAEACAARIEDLEELPGGGMALRVMQPKGLASGAVRRTVGIDPQSSSYLRAWLEVRPAVTGLPASSGPLFASSTGKALLTAHCRRLVARLGLAAGLGRVHPHALRGLGASEMVRENFSIRHVQLALGHANLSVTHAYIQSIGCNESTELMAGRKWSEPTSRG